MNKTAVTATIRAIIATNPVTFTHGTKSITGSKTGLSKEDKLTGFGLDGRYALSLYAILADFNTEPKTDDVITIGTIDYRVIITEIDAVDVGIKIHLGKKI